MTRRVSFKAVKAAGVATERAIIEQALRDTKIQTWHIAAAAKLLGVPLSTMKWKINKLRITKASIVNRKVSDGS
jgi:transcriptional regulator with GAF, ATPase, and Fis domain